MNLGRRVVAGVVGVALVVGGVAVAAPASAAPSVSSASVSHVTYDASTVFRGVFFGHGPVAALFPRYFQGVPAVTQVSTVAENMVMVEVERRSSGLIDRFYQAVRSGSHVRTKNAMKALVTTLKDIHDAEASADPGDFSGQCVAAVAAVAVAVWLPIVLWTPLWTPSSQTVTAMEPVTADGVVHDLVTRLS